MVPYSSCRAVGVRFKVKLEMDQVPRTVIPRRRGYQVICLQTQLAVALSTKFQPRLEMTVILEQRNLPGKVLKRPLFLLMLGIQLLLGPAAILIHPQQLRRPLTLPKLGLQPILLHFDQIHHWQRF